METGVDELTLFLVHHLLLTIEVPGAWILCERKLNPHQHHDFLQNRVLFILPAWSVLKGLSNSFFTYEAQVPKAQNKGAKIILIVTYFFISCS